MLLTSSQHGVAVFL
jgi:hypothetical protein